MASKILIFSLCSLLKTWNQRLWRVNSRERESVCLLWIKHLGYKEKVYLVHVALIQKQNLELPYSFLLAFRLAMIPESEGSIGMPPGLALAHWLIKWSNVCSLMLFFQCLLFLHFVLTEIKFEDVQLIWSGCEGCTLISSFFLTKWGAL